MNGRKAGRQEGRKAGRQEGKKARRQEGRKAGRNDRNGRNGRKGDERCERRGGDADSAGGDLGGVYAGVLGCDISHHLAVDE